MRVVHFVLTIFAMLAFMPIAAYATDVAAVDDGGFIAMIVSALPALAELLPAWVAGLIISLYAVSHAITMLPALFTARWPIWLKTLINLLAANYGKSKNKDV